MKHYKIKSYTKLLWFLFSKMLLFHSFSPQTASRRRWRTWECVHWSGCCNWPSSINRLGMHLCCCEKLVCWHSRQVMSQRIPLGADRFMMFIVLGCTIPHDYVVTVICLQNS